MKSFFIACGVFFVLIIFGVWHFGAQKAPVEPTPPIVTPPVVPTATYVNADAQKIVVDVPTPGASVGKSFTVSGKARGGWYLEASFPLEVLSSTGTQLLIQPVQAQGEWMTPEFVPFSSMISIPAWYTGAATLILHNDNPSGMPENAASISIPITIQ